MANIQKVKSGNTDEKVQGYEESTTQKLEDKKKKEESARGLEENRRKAQEIKEKKAKEDAEYLAYKEGKKRVEEEKRQRDAEMIRKAQEEAKKKPAPISGASPGDPDFEKKESLARKAKELESKNLAEVRREKEVKEKFTDNAKTTFETTKEYVPDRTTPNVSGNVKDTKSKFT